LTGTGDKSGAAIDDRALIADWVKRAKKGDVVSYQRLYDRFARRVLNFIYRMVNSPEEAEDLTQDTFVAVFRKLNTLKENDRFEAWLFRIARNFVYQKYRTREPEQVSVEELDEDGQPVTQIPEVRKGPEESFEAGELQDIVEGAIGSLPDKYREVFVLSAIQQLSYQEIADVVGRSLASVKTDIHRARLSVRKQVKNYLKVRSYGM
jgi:RNA polymerase sigma-70 factor, ECF subfamily